MIGMTPRLHPMTLGELLDTTFALYRRNFVLFAGVVAVMAVPQAIITLLLTLAIPTVTFTPSAASSPNFDVGTAIGGIFLLDGSGGIVSFILGTLATGALAAAISARYLGRPMTVVGAYETVGVRTFLRLLVATLLEAIVLIAGFVFLIIPGIFLLVRFLFIPETVVLERTGIFGAFGRSWRLVGGSWWRVFGIGLVLAIMVGILQGAIGGALNIALSLGHGTGASLAGAAIGAIVGIFVQPIQLGALTLLYYDLRIRKEGFDLEQMARDLESSPLR